jgi:hypothetical protein
MPKVRPAAIFLSTVAAVILPFACKVYDPLFCDQDTPCKDPERPFCDLLGEYPASEGVARTCIPDPNSGNSDAGPGDPDASAAPVPCSPPGEAVSCDADTLVLCSEDSLEQRVTCPLGCAPDEPRCLDLQPSNELAEYLDPRPSSCRRAARIDRHRPVRYRFGQPARR